MALSNQRGPVAFATCGLGRDCRLPQELKGAEYVPLEGILNVCGVDSCQAPVHDMCALHKLKVEDAWLCAAHAADPDLMSRIYGKLETVSVPSIDRSDAVVQRIVSGWLEPPIPGRVRGPCSDGDQ